MFNTDIFHDKAVFLSNFRERAIHIVRTQNNLSSMILYLSRILL